MKIPMLDRAVYFGDGCYDATTFANNHIFGKKDHFDRFYNSCRLLDINFTMSREELETELQKCIDANELDHGMLYWQASRGTGLRSHNYPADIKPNLMAFTVPCELYPMDKTMKLISMEDIRFLMCNVKTLNLIPSVQAYQKCIEEGCQETVFHRGDRVTAVSYTHLDVYKRQAGALAATGKYEKRCGKCTAGARSDAKSGFRNAESDSATLPVQFLEYNPDSMSDGSDSGPGSDGTFYPVSAG